MKLILYTVLFTIVLLQSNVLSYINAEPEPYDVFIKKYQPLLDTAHDQKLSPKKQLELGIKMQDIICFDSKVQILKLSHPAFVACVKAQTAQELSQRGWGILKSDNRSGEILQGIECKHAWTMEFEGDIAPKSAVVKTLKIALLKISEQILWYPMEVSYVSSSMSISAQGTLNEDEINNVKKSLNTLENVTNVTYQQGPCI